MEDVKKLKKELLQLKFWEEKRLEHAERGDAPPPLATLVEGSSPPSSSTPPVIEAPASGNASEKPATSSPDSSDTQRATPEGSFTSSEARRPPSTTIQGTERLRRREMARQIANVAQRLKQEHMRRIEQVDFATRLSGKHQSHHPYQQSGHRPGTSTTHRSESFSTRTRSSTASHRSRPETTPSPAGDQASDVQHYKQAWARYAAGWSDLTSPPTTPGASYTFATFPWPTVHPPQSLADLNKESISDFIYHAPPSYTPGIAKQTKAALHEAVRRWHPDRAVWFTQVADSDKVITRKGADIVI
ncbi:hypothetical protein FRB99_000950, partial [Tulasnella sp. 403]